MQKQIGAVLLVAGTCIGSGIIALPLVLAKLCLVPSTLLMLFIWYIMYYTSLVNLELNLQTGHGLSLGALARRFSGKTAEFVSTISLKLLSYSLLAVFIYGGASVIQELVATKFLSHYSFHDIATYYALAAIALLLLPIRWIDYCNRLLFIGLLAVVAILLAGLVLSVQWTHLPLFSDTYTGLTVWAAVIPVVFTSFGFQVIFHTLSNYCNMNPKMLKKAFFWGSLIPAIVYFLWTCGILSVVYHHQPEFYSKMAAGEADVGSLIHTLGSIAQWESIQLLVWWISLLAIATSVLGVGVGLCQSLQNMLEKRIANPVLNKLVAAFATILPAYLVVLYVPNAFIAVLGFAGMILALIAILIPVYLFFQSDKKRYHYPELQWRWLIYLSIATGVIVIASELYNITG